MKNYSIIGILLLLITFSGCDLFDRKIESKEESTTQTDATYLSMVAEIVSKTLSITDTAEKSQIKKIFEPLFKVTDSAVVLSEKWLTTVKLSDELFDSLKWSRSNNQILQPEKVKEAKGEANGKKGANEKGKESEFDVKIPETTKAIVRTDVFNLFLLYNAEKHAPNESYFQSMVLLGLILIVFFVGFYYYRKIMDLQNKLVDSLNNSTASFRQQVQNVNSEFQRIKTENQTRFESISNDINLHVSGINKKLDDLSNSTPQSSSSNYKELGKYPPKPLEKIFYVKSATFSDSDPVKLSENDFKDSSSGNFYKVTLRENEGIIELNMEEKRNFGPIYENPNRFILPFCNCIIDNAKRYNAIESTTSGKLIRKGQYWEIVEKINAKLIEA